MMIETRRRTALGIVVCAMILCMFIGSKWTTRSAHGQGLIGKTRTEALLEGILFEEKAQTRLLKELVRDVATEAKRIVRAIRR